MSKIEASWILENKCPDLHTWQLFWRVVDQNESGCAYYVRFWDPQELIYLDGFRYWTLFAIAADGTADSEVWDHYYVDKGDVVYVDGNNGMQPI